MRWKRTCLVALLTILIVGTSCAAPRSINEESISPIDQRWGLVLLQNLKVRSLAMFDPEKGEIVRQIALGRFAADYAFAPNGKIYIPLHQDPQDKEAHVAVLDRTTGKLEKLLVQAWAMTELTITGDGTAYIVTGMIPKESDGQFILLLDTYSNKALGLVPLPGTVKRPVALSEDRVLMPVNRPQRMGGNVYVVDREMGKPTKLFPTDLLPTAPDQIIVDAAGQTAYLLWGGEIDEYSRSRFKDLLPDPRLLDPRIEVWDLPSMNLVRRIHLTPPATRTMVLSPSGQLFVGHGAEQGQAPVSHISVVDPGTGSVTRLQTVFDPAFVQVHGDYLYVASNLGLAVEVFRLNGLASMGQMAFPSNPFIPPMSISAR